MFDLPFPVVKNKQYSEAVHANSTFMTFFNCRSDAHLKNKFKS